MSQNLSSAAVVIGALRVKFFFFLKETSGSNGLDPDQDQLSVGSDLGPNLLHLGYQQRTKVAAIKD